MLTSDPRSAGPIASAGSVRDWVRGPQSRCMMAGLPYPIGHQLQPRPRRANALQHGNSLSPTVAEDPLPRPAPIWEAQSAYPYGAREHGSSLSYTPIRPRSVAGSHYRESI
ncbi:hypothetical protein VTO73DRAFT_8063 [Trametes versicolor]